MIIDYAAQKTFTDSVDIIDAGNCCLRCSDNSGGEYYVVTKTVMGKTGILKFGPVVADMAVLLENFSVEYKKIDYKEPMIQKEISKYINDARKQISSVENAVEPEAWTSFPDIAEAFNNM